MATDPRIVLDARLDDGQVWIVAEPDDVLRKPPAELAPVLGPRPRAIFKSFWVAPTGGRAARTPPRRHPRRIRPRAVSPGPTRDHDHRRTRRADRSEPGLDRR